MSRGKLIIILLALVIVSGAVVFGLTRNTVKETGASVSTLENPENLVPGRVTMIDLGAKSCVPCKMMAPILEKLHGEYKGTANILFIDVWEKPEMAQQFNVRTIPTQIFYDHNNEERFRHVGFFSEEEIKEVLEQLLKEQADGV